VCVDALSDVQDKPAAMELSHSGEVQCLQTGTGYDQEGESSRCIRPQRITAFTTMIRLGGGGHVKCTTQVRLQSILYELHREIGRV
jgi:hypothetical protein